MKMKENNLWGTETKWALHPSLESFQTTAQGREIKMELNQFPELDKWNLRSRGLKHTKVRELYTEAQRSSEALPKIFSTMIRACTWIKRRGQGKDYLSESIKVNSAQCTPRTRINACSYQPNGKLINHEVQGRTKPQ